MESVTKRAAKILGPLCVVPLAVFSACSSSPEATSTTTSSSSGSSGSSGSPSGSTSSSSSSSSSGSASTGPVATHSSSIAVSPDGLTVYVVNADVDSVSVIDTGASKLVREIPLGSGPPSVDAKGHYTPNIQPRALALSPGKNLLYVTGERSSSLYAIDLSSNKVTKTVAVGSEPIGVLVSPDETTVYVACATQGTVVKIDAGAAAVTGTATITDGSSPLGYTIPAQPWALGWSLDYASIYVTHLVSPNVSVLDASTFTVSATVNIPDVASRGNRSLANGQARGLYDVVARPGTSEVWVAHMMLAVDTPETNDPATTLDFESTAFPTLSILTNNTFNQRLSTNAMSVPGINGAFADIVSGPHAVAFTSDGAYALMLDSASEDVLAVDANGKVEAQLARPLYVTNGTPGHMLEGIVISPDGTHAYVDERNTSDVAIIDIDRSSGINLTVTSPSIPRLAEADPMPATLRQGQFLFNTANSELVGITNNNWVACASCHVEGGSDAVTWKFLAGPRDTPSNAGGKSDTGFLLRTADRRVVADYWQTVDQEQGGSFGGTVSDAGVATAPTDPTIYGPTGYMQAIEAYVNFAIPLPVPPQQDAALVQQGSVLFYSSTTLCSTCHSGPAFTDSCSGNPGLDTVGGCVLEGPVTLHDVGTCVTTGFPDVPHTDEDGNPRNPCVDGFNTPSLRGLAATAPYLHDGSAATLYDLIAFAKAGKIKMGDTSSLTPAQIDALVAFLRSL